MEVQPSYEAVRRQSYALAKSLQTAAPTTGLKPIGWTAEVTYDPNAEAWTYLMRFGRRDVWKIGHTQDVERRLEELNLHVPQEALNECWALVQRKRWENSVQAYEMEQALLRMLEAHRTIGERVRCAGEIILSVWESAASKGGEAASEQSHR